MLWREEIYYSTDQIVSVLFGEWTASNNTRLTSLQASTQNITFLQPQLKFFLYFCAKPLLFVVEFLIKSASLDFFASYKYVPLSLQLCLHLFVQILKKNKLSWQLVGSCMLHLCTGVFPSTLLWKLRSCNFSVAKIDIQSVILQGILVLFFFIFFKNTDKTQVYIIATVHETLCNVQLFSESCRWYFKM